MLVGDQAISMPASQYWIFLTYEHQNAKAGCTPRIPFSTKVYVSTTTTAQNMTLLARIRHYFFRGTFSHPEIPLAETYKLACYLRKLKEKGLRD
jgi:hypothetical protein